jgi:two-component system, OmpR family, alkaline phosphatase synthesis response regulator PhoP
MQKILIVEDETSSAEMLSFVLQQEGYDVVVAGNGAEALKALRREGINLVLCDLMMPIMDGREFCRAMHADPDMDDIPIIIMSAAPEVSISHLAEEGCQYSSFMRKPLDLDLLTATVRNLITTSA